MNRKAVVTSLSLLWISHLFMDFFTGIWPIYKTLAEIDLATAGLIAGISGFIGETLQIGFGYFCDRGYRKRILLFGLASSSAIIWVTFTTGYFSAFLLMLLMMIGSGSFHPAAAGMSGALSGTHKGKFILLFASGGAVGLAISQLVFTKLLTFFDGHALVVLLPLFVLLALIPFHKFPTPTSCAAPSLKTFLEPILRSKKPLMLLYFSQLTAHGLVLAFLFLLPDVLKARGCDSWLCLGGGHFCFVLSSACTMIPAGYLCDKYGQKRVLLSVFAASALFFYLFLIPLSFGGTVALLSCLGGVLGIANPIIVSWGNRLVPESPSTVSGLLMGCAWCFSHLGPACAGLLSCTFKTEPYTSTLSILGMLTLLNVVLIALMPNPLKQPAPPGLQEGIG